MEKIVTLKLEEYEGITETIAQASAAAEDYTVFAEHALRFIVEHQLDEEFVNYLMTKDRPEKGPIVTRDLLHDVVEALRGYE